MAEKDTGFGEVETVEEKEADPRKAAADLGITARPTVAYTGEPYWVDSIYLNPGTINSARPYHLDSFALTYNTAVEYYIGAYELSDTVGIVKWTLYDHDEYDDVHSISTVYDGSDLNINVASEEQTTVVDEDEDLYETKLEVDHDSSESVALRERFGWNDAYSSVSGALEAAIDTLVEAVLQPDPPEFFNQVIYQEPTRLIKYTMLTGSSSPAQNESLGVGGAGSY